MDAGPHVDFLTVGRVAWDWMRGDTALGVPGLREGGYITAHLYGIIGRESNSPHPKAVFPSDPAELPELPA